MGQGSFLLTAIGTVILVPPVEECLYRGLIFRKLADKSLWVAYAVSILAFAMLHIVGYLGRYTLLEVLLAMLQYLPGGLCLAWCYTKADSIYAPILVHAAINALAWCYTKADSIYAPILVHAAINAAAIGLLR